MKLWNKSKVSWKLCSHDFHLLLNLILLLLLKTFTCFCLYYSEVLLHFLVFITFWLMTKRGRTWNILKYNRVPGLSLKHFVLIKLCFSCWKANRKRIFWKKLCISELPWNSVYQNFRPKICWALQGSINFLFLFLVFLSIQLRGRF